MSKMKNIKRDIDKKKIKAAKVIETKEYLQGLTVQGEELGNAWKAIRDGYNESLQDDIAPMFVSICTAVMIHQNIKKIDVSTVRLAKATIKPAVQKATAWKDSSYKTNMSLLVKLAKLPRGKQGNHTTPMPKDTVSIKLNSKLTKAVFVRDDADKTVNSLVAVFNELLKTHGSEVMQAFKNALINSKYGNDYIFKALDKKKIKKLA